MRMRLTDKHLAGGRKGIRPITLLAYFKEVRYWVQAALITDQLHLSPVKATVQLRPSFQHYDAAKAGERRRKQPEEGSRPRAVQVLFHL